MNPAYQRILAASDDERRGLFVTAATRVGTTVQNIEKDFWVCWTLDALFHRLKEDSPRLLFKGGTSLSKGYGLISRFSEDIDITVFRADIGEEIPFDQLVELSNNKRKERLDAIKASCQAYIDQTLRVELNDIARKTMEAADKDPTKLSVILDDEDKDRQSLLILYPTVVERSAYVTPSVKIEAGAKSALDPHQDRVIVPYLAPDFSESGALGVTDVTTINPERTFLDKLVILHGMTFYFAARGGLRGSGRVSRHYYDVHCLMGSSVGGQACADHLLIDDCVQHARTFFDRKDAGLGSARRGSFRLRPAGNLIGLLKRDYEAMATMIFGDVPSFESVLESVGRAEDLLNEA